HREDGPAVEFSNGDKFWYQNGKLHREDGPAAEWVHGNKYWYKNDVLYKANNHIITNNHCNKCGLYINVYEFLIGTASYLCKIKLLPSCEEIIMLKALE